MPRLSITPVLVLALGLACTEPNPYAQDTVGDGGTNGDGTDTEPDPPGCGEPQCSLAIEIVEFSVQGSDSFTAEIPKPPQAKSVPIAAVHRYAPGQSDTLGYAILWTDNGDSYGLEITTTGAAPNSRISGVAAVIGLGDDFPAPEVHELEVTTADMCGTLSSDPLEGRFVVETVERYEPGDASVFEFSRTGSIADEVSLEYCVATPEAIEAAIGVKLAIFELPEGALGLEAAALLDSNTGASDNFSELGNVGEIVHLIGAQEFSEEPQPGLGYAIECATTQAPYGCNYELLGFSDGAAVAVAGSVLAIQ